MAGISNLTAAQLSRAAYGTTPPPDGWTAQSTVATPDGNNSFTVFINTSTQQAVIAFKGSDNVSNFKSDLLNSGGSAWADIKPLAEQALANLRTTGYEIMTDGHSLGGGMAQTMALENNLSGYGQNSLPISQDAIRADIVANGSMLESALAVWHAGNNTFNEVNISGDPATLYYSSLQGQTYLNNTPTTLASSYAACEATGVVLSAIAGPIGTAMTADCAAKAHSINTVIGMLEGSPSQTGDIAAVDAAINANAAAIENSFLSTNFTVQGGNFIATATNGLQADVSVINTDNASVTYTLSINGANNQIYTVFTNQGGTGTGLTEQFAVTNSILNLTQVSDFANGQFIGGGIIEGQATLAQLNQEATLASSFSESMSLARAQDPFLAALNVQSNSGITQGFELADQTATSNAIPATAYAGGISEANFVSGQAATDNVNGLSDSRLQNIKADLSADPTVLALEDGVLAVRLAQQNPSTLNVLTALQKVLLAGNTLSTEFLATTATLLNSTPADVNNLIINGGATLNSIIAAYQNPTPISVAAAAMKLLQTNIPITNEMKVATAQALGLNTTDLTDMNNLLAYGGAGLAVVSALKNPTPQNIVQSSQQVVSAISYITKDAGKYSQLTTGLQNANIFLNLLDFAKNPNPNTALSATLSIGTKLGWVAPEFMAALIIAETILPGPTTKIINEVYNTANSILNNIAAAANGIMSAVSSVMTSVLDPIANFFSSLFGPLALNLTGGNVHTTNLAVAGAPLFDINGDGTQVQTGWIAPNEGFLVRDLNGDGQINSVKEMFSERNSTVGKSAFGTLAELDGNMDGKIDQMDRAWNDLKIWVDKNGDGISQANELYTLEQLGIASIDLNAKHGFSYDNGNIIGDTSTFTYTDGSHGQIADAILATKAAGAANPNNLIVMGNNATTVELSNGKTAQIISGSGQTVNVSNTGVNVVVSQGGNTVIAGSNNGVVLVGGTGDVLNAGYGTNTTLVGNGGASLIGNASNTNFIVDGTANTVTTGSGTSNVQVNGTGNTVNAGAGSDLINVAGSGNNILIGSGDKLSVSAGGNTLNLQGNNSIVNSTAAGNVLFVSGTGDTVNLSNGNITVGNNSNVSITGSLDNIAAGTGDILQISGTNDTTTAGAGSQVNVTLASGRETVNVTSGTAQITDSVTLLGAGAAGVNVYSANGALNQRQTLSQNAAGLSVNVQNISTINGALLDNTNATVSADGTSANVSVGVYANNDTVNLAGTVIGTMAANSAVATTIQMSTQAANTHLNIGGNSISADVGSNVTVQGYNNTLAISAYNSAAVYGSGNYLAAAGYYNTTVAIGNGNNTQASGIGNYALSNGTGNTTLSYGVGNNTQSNANYDYTLGSGVYNTTLGYGNGNNTQASGTANYTQATGIGNTTLNYGYANNTQSNGNYDYTLGSGISNLTLGYGSGNTTVGSGIGNNTQSLGVNDYTVGSGISNLTLGYGSGNTTVGSGIGNNTQSLGANDYTVGSGVFNTTLSYGVGDVTVSSGLANNTQSIGNNDVTLGYGTLNTTLGYGANNTTISNGYGNNTQSFGVNDNTVGIGTFNTTLSYGANDVTIGIGIANNTQSLGNNDFTATNGILNTALTYGSNSTTISAGFADVAISTGTNDTTCAIGTGVVAVQTQSNQMTGILQAGLNSLISSMAAFAPPTAGQMGVLIGSQASQPVLLAAGY